MFKENKYTIIYYKIIENATEIERNRNNQYLEKHHIIPKSLGGPDNSENIVLLTFKEHYICHRLLCKMVDDEYKPKMLYALYKLSHCNEFQNRELSFHQRIKCLESNREACKTRNHKPHLGRLHSQESKDKISNSLKGRKLSETHKNNLALMNKRTNSSRAKAVSEKMKNKPKSDEHRKKISENMKRIWQERKQQR